MQCIGAKGISLGKKDVHYAILFLQHQMFVVHVAKQNFAQNLEVENVELEFRNFIHMIRILLRNFRLRAFYFQ